MRLKSLELIGYKTFASKTTFEFAENITAIVGPNGSGKSNVVDALRWVLGEQSYSLLRGRKTVDMIFSGSEHRARAGMASATVLFDNTDGWLPIDFTEVAVTRRAYRDGQNEYLLNGQKVRLRDISELLSQSGLAQRTYTMVGQGLVDVALSLKAEERRKLFEEAAGIGLYRSRREEALRRLETTRRNLERVQDILAELKPRLRSLERQARRAREYEQVKADLEVMLREWYGYHWHRAQRDLKAARRLAHQQEQRLNAVRARQSSLDQQLSTLRSGIQTLRTKLNDWHRQMAQLHNQREQLGRELAVSAERKRALEDRRDALSVRLARLEEEIRLHQERFEQARQHLAQYQSQAEEARRQLAEAEQALQSRQVERQQAEAGLRAVEKQQDELKTRLIELNARREELRAAVDRQRDTLAGVQRRLVEAESGLASIAERLQLAEQALDQARQARQQIQTELDTRRETLSGLEAERRRMAETLEARRAVLTRLQTQLEVLQQAEQSLAGYAEGARALLEAARAGRLKQARGALSGVLDVPAAFEIAIAAALGEFLDGVLLEGEPERVLKLLDSGAGRVALLPLGRLRGGTDSTSWPDGPGVIGVASEVVKTSPELRPVVEALLGRTLVVADQGAALRALNDLPPGSRAVTLEGEVFHAEGPILAGKRASAGTLGRVRQRRELSHKLEAAQADVAAVEAQLQALETRMAAAREQVDQLQNRLRQARAEEEAALQAYNQVVGEHQAAANQRQWRLQQRESLEQEIQQALREVEAMGESRVRLEAEIAAAQEAWRQARHRLAELSLEEHQNQVAHWKTQAAVVQRVVSEAGTRAEERRLALERARNERAAQRAEMEQLEENLEKLGAERAELRQRENRLGEQVAELLALIQPAEAELDAGETQLDSLQQAEARARHELTLAERYHSQAQIELARSQEALENMREKIEDDFGLVAFEYEEEVTGPTPLPLGEEMVAKLPLVHEIAPELGAAIKRQRAQLRRIGAINPEAQQEYEEVRQRYEFTVSQIADLEQAEEDIRQVIAELDALMEAEFRRTFEAVAKEFKAIFTRLFGGGSAQLVLTDPDDLTHTGVDIQARLPGRRSQELSLLSGGERSLTATALIFSLLKVSPTPFCVLDEVDAMLDEANVNRFADLLRELSLNTQFVIITHNRNTVQVADTIYGVTMGKDSTSQVLGLRLDDVATALQPEG